MTIKKQTIEFAIEHAVKGEVRDARHFYEVACDEAIDNGMLKREFDDLFHEKLEAFVRNHLETCKQCKKYFEAEIKTIISNFPNRSYYNYKGKGVRRSIQKMLRCCPKTFFGNRLQLDLRFRKGGKFSLEEWRFVELKIDFFYKQGSVFDDFIFYLYKPRLLDKREVKK